MIPSEHRYKGGALLLGAEVHGEPGPFGTWTDECEQEHDDGHDVAGPDNDDLRC